MAARPSVDPRHRPTTAARRAAFAVTHLQAIRSTTTPSTPSTHHTGGDTGHVAPYGVEDTAALLTTSETAGGHLIERHVAQTFDDLAALLEATRLQTVSTFATADEAASAVSTALQ